MKFLSKKRVLMGIDKNSNKVFLVVKVLKYHNYLQVMWVIYKYHKA